MVFGRKKGFLSSWTSSRSVDTDHDVEFKARAYKLEAMHKTIAEIHFNIQVYAASWQAMCKASAAIAEGLAKLAAGGAGGGVGSGGGASSSTGQDKKGAWSLGDAARMYRSAQQAIDKGVREPSQRVLEDTTLRETGTLLSRFPPIFAKIARRKQLLAEVEAAKSKVRAAEAAREKERDSFAVVAGNEHRRRMSSTLATATVVAAGVTEEVAADADRLEREREAMLVPQISALVGCQAYFMRRSAAVLERLAEQLPFSALALCKLLPPAGAAQKRRQTSSASASTLSVDFSTTSFDSSASTAIPTSGGGGGGGGSSRSSLSGPASPPPLLPPPPQRPQKQSNITPALDPADPSGLLSMGSSTSRPPPFPTPPPGSPSSSPSALASATAGAAASSGSVTLPSACPPSANAAPLLPPRGEEGGMAEVAVEGWRATGIDENDVGGDVEVSW